MKRFLAVVMALALGTVTAHAQQQEHRGRGNHGNSGNSARHSQQDVSRSENHRQNGERNRSRVDSAPLAIPQQQPLLAQNQGNDRNRSDNRGRGGDSNRRDDNTIRAATARATGTLAYVCLPCFIPRLTTLTTQPTAWHHRHGVASGYALTRM